MSTLREELVSKVMNKWDGVNMDKQHKLIPEQLYDFVKANPYSVISEISPSFNLEVNRLGTQLKFLVDRGILGRELRPIRNYSGFGPRNNYAYYVLVDSYMEGAMKAKSGRKKYAKKQRPDLGEIQAPQRMKQFAEAPKDFNPEMFVQDLSLKEARAVYEVLKGYFSG
jgi:hypothetical protein